MSVIEKNFSKGFYYSHTYPLMSTVQDNYKTDVAILNSQDIGRAIWQKIEFDPAKKKKKSKQGNRACLIVFYPPVKVIPRDWKLMPRADPFSGQFVWNSYITKPLRETISLRSAKRWTVPLIHGFFSQSIVSLFGRRFKIILVARRSRLFAGTRYLKRGVNDDGYVANSVETEQVHWVDQSRSKLSSWPIWQLCIATQSNRLWKFRATGRGMSESQRLYKSEGQFRFFGRSKQILWIPSLTYCCSILTLSTLRRICTLGRDLTSFSIGPIV